MIGLIGRVDSQRIALPVTLVETVLPMIEIAPLPKCPRPVAGLINLRGRAVPVIDLRRQLFRRATRPTPEMLLVVTADGHRRFALAMDAVEGVAELAEEAVPAALPGVASAPGGLIYLYEPGALLEPGEEARLAAALAGHPAGVAAH